MFRLGMLLILISFIVSVYSIEYQKSSNGSKENSSVLKNAITDAMEESRRRKVGHYFIHPFHGWHALSWIYWIKVKLIVIAFFVGTAFIWAIQYLGKFYHSCPSVGHYGHYRALQDDPIIDKLLQSLNYSWRSN